MSGAVQVRDLVAVDADIHVVSCKVAGAPHHRVRCRHDLVGQLLEPQHLVVIFFPDDRREVQLRGPLVDPWTLAPLASQQGNGNEWGDPEAGWVTVQLQPGDEPDWVSAVVDARHPVGLGAARVARDVLLAWPGAEDRAWAAAPSSATAAAYCSAV